jgi:hypothetical protein
MDADLFMLYRRMEVRTDVGLFSAVYLDMHCRYPHLLEVVKVIIKTPKA